MTLTRESTLGEVFAERVAMGQLIMGALGDMMDGREKAGLLSGDPSMMKMMESFPSAAW